MQIKAYQIHLYLLVFFSSNTIIEADQLSLNKGLGCNQLLIIKFACFLCLLLDQASNKDSLYQID